MSGPFPKSRYRDQAATEDVFAQKPMVYPCEKSFRPALGRLTKSFTPSNVIALPAVTYLFSLVAIAGLLIATLEPLVVPFRALGLRSMKVPLATSFSRQKPTSPDSLPVYAVDGAA